MILDQGANWFRDQIDGGILRCWRHYAWRKQRIDYKLWFVWTWLINMLLKVTKCKTTMMEIVVKLKNGYKLISILVVCWIDWLFDVLHAFALF